MRVLVTGGTGSLGSALVRQFAAEGVERIGVYSRDEVKQGELAASLGVTSTNPQIRFFLGDVRDRRRLEDAMWGMETVIHTAALKRVDQVSYNPSEVLKTNVLGTQRVLQAAMDAHVAHVLLISSDKAVHPVNVYGATKQMAEFLTVRQNVYSIPRGIRCSVLRYGNVWGSRGSVVEVFHRQLRTGSTLTVTNPDMTRFYVTLPQAVEYVKLALDKMIGGEIFVPKLRAWTLGQLATIFQPSAITYTGNRAGGEKLHEQLISDEEERRVVDSGALYVVTPDPHEWTQEYYWDTYPRYPLHHYASDDVERLLGAQLIEIVREYCHAQHASGSASP